MPSRRSSRTSTARPCGRVVGLTGAPTNLDLGPDGPLLCDLTSPLVVIEFAPAPGAPFVLPVPNKMPLIGVPLCAQGASIDSGLGAHWANALDVTIGSY